MRMTIAVRAALGLFGVVAILSCGDGGTRPKTPCYTVDELFAAGVAVSDSMAAREAFVSYLGHLDETGGYPVFGWTHLEYLRSSGAEDYAGRRYWGIVSRGRDQDGETVDNQHFRVRDDGVVVLMLGCI